MITRSMILEPWVVEQIEGKVRGIDLSNSDLSNTAMFQDETWLTWSITDLDSNASWF